MFPAHFSRHRDEHTCALKRYYVAEHCSISQKQFLITLIDEGVLKMTDQTNTKQLKKIPQVHLLYKNTTSSFVVCFLRRRGVWIRG